MKLSNDTQLLPFKLQNKDNSARSRLRMLKYLPGRRI